MTTLTNINNKSFVGGDTMEYLIIGNTYVIKDGNVCDGWYIIDGEWKFDPSMMDEPYFEDYDDDIYEPMEGEYLIIGNEYVIGSSDN